VARYKAEKLLHSPQAEYPPLARQARIQGIVRLHVIVSQGGEIANIELRAGHPLLVPSATEAVKQYRYRPTYVNGSPIEVETDIDVNFNLQ
jgi:protein TonB